MVKEKTKPKRKRSCHRIPEEVKISIAKERHLEGKSTAEIAGEYGLSITSVNRILSTFAAKNQSDDDGVGADNRLVFSTLVHRAPMD